MKRIVLWSISLSVIFAAIEGFGQSASASAPNGIMQPEGYKSWPVIALSYRADNGTLRVILGNKITMTAVDEGNTLKWPEGTILAKIVWKSVSLEKWESASVPGEFVHSEFMIKDSKKYPETGGWGFARWIGLEQRPYGNDASFVKECFGCHQPVKARDYVFTKPAQYPHN